jgi:hypothetical protein
MNPIIKRNFSYIKNGGKTYTFKKLVWLNDIVNNPEYKNLLEEYRKFDVWSQEEIGRKSSSFTKSLNDTLKNVEDFLQDTVGIINVISSSDSINDKLALMKTGKGTLGIMPDFYTITLKPMLTIYYLIQRINGMENKSIKETINKYTIEPNKELSKDALIQNMI